MKWTRGGRSADLEDRRGEVGGGGGLGGLGGLGGGGGLRLPVGRMGIGGIVLLLIIGYLTRGSIFGGGDSGAPVPAPSQPQGSRAPASASQDDDMVQFVSFVLDDLQRTWEQKLGSRYRHAKLVLFSGQTRTACGLGEEQMGPFYCPPDEKVYIDLMFYRELASRFGAPGDFAQAYVLAHEMGHHVQKLLGTEEKMRRMQRDNPEAANELSVRLELQADCYAGVWGHSTGQRQLIEKGDIEEGLGAAAAVGDDRLQKQAGGRVAPESFTHGTSEQRARWLRRGLSNGDIQDCDTFGAREL